MYESTKLVDKLEGVENFCAWNYIKGIILEEDDLEKFIKENVSELEEDESKEKYKKDMIKDKRMITDSIKDDLIPQISSKNNPKYISDSMTTMYEGMNIKWKKKLRTELKNTRMQKGEIVQDYFSRVS
jgi:hypothetical protein